VGEAWRYEPKWDGFRSIIFRHGDEVELGSRNAKPLTRYFPEVVEHVLAAFPDDAVVDGELVIVGDNGAVDFDLLSLRVHQPFDVRRARLLDALNGKGKGIYVTPMTTDPDEAQVWFEQWEGAGLDGVMAKKGDDIYHPGQRTMLKIKHERTIECAVAGFRWHKDGQGVGSLLLGLYDNDGNLHHVGVTASFTAAKRRELVDELAPLREGAAENHPWGEWANLSASGSEDAPTGNRWNAGKDMSWEPLRVELVVEVAYGHFQGGMRMRHAGSFRRLRYDRDPRSCTYEQVQTPDNVSITEVLAAT
jgi:ATP-dependent DNA ligase